MKIAVVANTAWNIRNFRLGLMRFLRDEGYEVVAIAPPDDSVQILENEGFKFIPLEKLSRKGTNPLADLALIWEFQKIYRREKIGVALQYTIKPNIYGSIAAWLAGTRSVSTVTGLGYSFLNPGLVNRVAKLLYRFAFRFSDVICFQNRDDFEVFTQNGLASAAKCQVVPGSGIDTEHFSPAFPPRPLKGELPVEKLGRQAFTESTPPFGGGGGGTSTTFLFVGRLLRDKGIHELAEAISLISQRRNDVQFWLLGELDTGNPAAISEAELAEILKNPTVKHLGTTPDPRPFLAACDCLVLPSYREGLPRASLEAMSMAKPIVTTDVPGCRDTVEEGRNGFLVPVQDGPGLAAGLEKFLQKTAAERAEMGEFSRRKALAEFDLRIVQQRYLAILASLNPTKTT